MRRGKRAPSGHRCGEWHPKAKAGAGIVQRARQLRAHGWTYPQIGADLGVNPRTVADWCQYVTRING